METNKIRKDQLEKIYDYAHKMGCSEEEIRIFMKLCRHLSQNYGVQYLNFYHRDGEEDPFKDAMNLVTPGRMKVYLFGKNHKERTSETFLKMKQESAEKVAAGFAKKQQLKIF